MTRSKKAFISIIIFFAVFSAVFFNVGIFNKDIPEAEALTAEQVVLCRLLNTDFQTDKVDIHGFALCLFHLKS